MMGEQLKKAISWILSWKIQNWKWQMSRDFSWINSSGIQDLSSMYILSLSPPPASPLLSSSIPNCDLKVALR